MPEVYVLDAEAAIDLARQGHTETSAGYEFYAPTLLRSQVFSVLHTKLLVENGDSRALLELAEAACRLPRRLLGDAVLRSTAWRIATDRGWHDTFQAEYIALTVLHGEALIAGDDTLRARAAGIVPTWTVDGFLARTEPEGPNS